MVKTCPKCNGKKRIDSKKHFSVKVPAGIANGQRLRLKEKGVCGVKGGKNGDIFVNIVVQKSELFERQGNDLHIKIPINAITATLGGDIKVKTPWGMSNAHINPMTCNGSNIVLKGEGVKTSSGNGNLIVEIEVTPLTNISNAQKELLNNLSSTLNDSNTVGLDKHKSMISRFDSSK
jgi:molecular chaperone DnaJ